MTTNVDADAPASFRRIAESWHPSPVAVVDVLSGAAGREFAALLDIDAPPLADGDPLPPLWHWFAFPPAHAASALGEDGHPRESSLVPPLPDRRRMFGGGALEVHRPMRVGEQVTRNSAVSDIRTSVGRSGPLLLTTVNHEFTVDGQVRVVETQEIVYRRAADVVATDPGNVPGTDPTDPPDTSDANRDGGRPRIDFVPDPVALFRFSTLTHNAHRIHYDRPYAIEVEGHPGLLVHGPLLALLLLEIPRRHDPRPVTQLSWRARRPVSDGTPVTAAGAADDGRWSCELHANGGVAVTADIRMGPS